MAKYVVQMSKEGGEPYQILDKTARAMVSDEVTARETAIATEAEARQQADQAEATARETAIATEAEARQQADQAEATARETAIATETTARETAVATEATAREAAVKKVKNAVDEFNYLANYDSLMVNGSAVKADGTFVYHANYCHLIYPARNNSQVYVSGYDYGSDYPLCVFLMKNRT